MPTDLLLAEDDQNLGFILKEYLELNGFSVDWAKDGVEAEQLFRNHHFDLCILDVMMPKKDGFSLAREIRDRDQQIPLIFLTAKALKTDKLKGYQIGADDYIVKPVDEELLIAKIRSIIRRTTSDTTSPTPESFTIGSYRFDPQIQRLVSETRVYPLTGKESELLSLLCKNKGTLLERRETLNKIWGDADYFNRRSMDVYISKLRKYLKEDSSISIKNVHGKGFVLED